MKETLCWFAILGVLVLAGAPIPAQSAAAEPRLIIDDIVCEGNETTRCDFIAKKYYQKPGETLDPGEVSDAELRLGTLIQFRDINIRLKKGAQRNHVIVVIEVQEASTIQYSLAMDYTTRKEFSHGDRNISDGIESDSFRLNTSVTDYNFLGLGKELTIGLSGSDRQSELTATGDVYVSDGSGGEPVLLQGFTARSESESYGLRLGYYDPHLFGSPRYYMYADVDYHRSRNHSRYDPVPAAGNTTGSSLALPDSESSTGESSGYSFQLGRRFQRFSRLSIAYAVRDISYDDDSSSFVTLVYERDSRNDTIFPTRGSIWTVSAARRYNDSQRLATGFTAHTSLGGGFILNTSASLSYTNHEDTISYTSGANEPVSYSYRNQNRGVNASLGVTKLNQVDTLEGRYAGWKASLSAGSMETDNTDSRDNVVTLDDRTDHATLRLEYIYQSTSLVTRFGVFYEEGGELF